MQGYRCGRPERVSCRSLAAAAGAAGLMLGLGGAVAVAATDQLGPVPAKVLKAVNSGGRQYVPAHHARPHVGKEAAVRTALSGRAPWQGCATGISLMHTTDRNRPSGRLVWLISVHPDMRILPIGGGPKRGHDHSRASSHAANFSVVVVSARTGREVEAEDGYSPKLGAWRAAAPSPCEDG